MQHFHQCSKRKVLDPPRSAPQRTPTKKSAVVFAKCAAVLFGTCKPSANSGHRSDWKNILVKYVRFSLHSTRDRLHTVSDTIYDGEFYLGTVSEELAVGEAFSGTVSEKTSGGEIDWSEFVVSIR